MTTSPRVSPESVGKQLLTDGVCYVPEVAAYDSNVMRAAIQGWLAFMDKPHQERQRWTMGNRDDPDDGYVYRSGDGGHDPNKHFFHFNPGTIANLMGVPNFYNTALSDWLVASNALFDACLHRLYALADSMDAMMPGYDFGGQVRTPLATGLHKLRYLYYGACQDAQDGDVVAKFHGDHSFVTLHVAESHTGMAYLDTNKREHLYERRPGSTLAFPGKKAAVLTDGRVPATRHGVRHYDAFAPHGENRWSIVFFGHIGIPSE